MIWNLTKIFAENHWGRKGVTSIMLGFYVALISGCATVMGPKTVEITQAQLEKAISQKFPFNSEALGLLDVIALKPRFQMLPEVNRVATDVDFNVSDKLFKLGFKASMSASYGLRIEPSDHTVRLTDLKVDAVKLGDVPVPIQGTVTAVAKRVAEGLLNDVVVYTIPDEDLQKAGQYGYRPNQLKVTKNGIALELIPQR